MKRVHTMLLAGGAAAVAIVLVLTSSASATPVVSATPGNMPIITSANSYVRKIAQCGSSMYAVGSFTQVGTPTGGRIARSGAFAFSATSGAVYNWNPNVNGVVDTIAFSADCTSVYLGGLFTNVNGVARTNLVKVNYATAAVDPAFNPAPDDEVFTLQQAHGHLIVGGVFNKIAGVLHQSLASLSLTTGALDTYVNLAVGGTLGSGRQKVYNFELSHSGNKLLAMGSFMTIGGVARQQIVMLDLGTSSTTVDAWYSPTFSQTCATTEPFYVQAAAWSPTDSRIYVAATGFQGTSPLCDAVTAFNATAASNQAIVWQNKTGCDSLYAVEANDTFVYIAGHERWMSNTLCNSKGPTAFDRPGIGAVWASNGTATSWNPTRDRGDGSDDLLLTAQGLWVASDTLQNSVLCAGAYHPGICFFQHR